MIRILLADDHPVVRRGLGFFLSMQKDMEIAGEASNGAEALHLAGELKPDIILMDLSMPEMDGVQATKAIKADFPKMKILILTSYADQDHVIPAIEAGASGYQLKDVEPGELAQSIRAILNGENKLHPKVTNHVLAHLSNGKKEKNPLTELTARELDVLKEIAKGKSNKEIAASLFITEKTVKSHVSNLLPKLQVSDRTQAALLAVREGLA
ncbi:MULTISPECIES: response regulator transcription factor [Bacillaceae]|uniref:Response regulator transcription factor n=1 Tax=Metabacillus sediminis TaxID=3117746 RepID=A0ABZ2NJ58_9BACI|nr:response regulator transcription factor [Bacillus sp. SJS]KZZ84683.1 DNA-binding response regulator [Bacillus sp. SJS]